MSGSYTRGMPFDARVSTKIEFLSDLRLSWPLPKNIGALPTARHHQAQIIDRFAE
jgi:hypothetical protein